MTAQNALAACDELLNLGAGLSRFVLDTVRLESERRDSVLLHARVNVRPFFLPISNILD